MFFFVLNVDYSVFWLRLTHKQKYITKRKNKRWFHCFGTLYIYLRWRTCKKKETKFFRRRGIKTYSKKSNNKISELKRKEMKRNYLHALLYNTPNGETKTMCSFLFNWNYTSCDLLKNERKIGKKGNKKMSI